MNPIIDRHQTTPDHGAVLTTTEARQAETTGRVRYILGFSVALAIVAMILAFVVF